MDNKPNKPMVKIGMVCEVCGSDELKKEGDSWVCQACGSHQSYSDVDPQSK